jgi:hypothetical protein
MARRNPRLRRRPTPRWALIALLGAVLAGCADSSAGQHLATSDADRFNQQAAAVNHAWEKFRVGGNACPVTASAGPCLAAAIQASAIEPATDALRGHVEHVQSSLGDGPCRRALRVLDSRLAAFHTALDTLRRDAGSSRSLDVLLADSHRVRPAWVAATAAQNRSTGAC